MAFSLFMLCYFRGAIFQLEHPPVNYLAGMRLQETGGIWRLISMQNWQLQVLIMEILQGGGAAIPSPLHFQVTISISNALCSEVTQLRLESLGVLN